MKKPIISSIIITAIITFFITNHFSKPIQNDHQDEHNNEEYRNDHEEKVESELNLNPEILEEFGIVLGSVSEGTLEKITELPGEIQIDPDRLAHITPRFEGIVKKVFKQIGERVEKNELLAVIESNESLTAYEVRSEIAGTVIEMHLTTGETINNSDHGFTVADLSEVWANLSVYQKDLPFIHLGQKTMIITDSKSPGISGTISYISPILDEHTRTATARVIINNSDGFFRPGQFITGQIITEREIVPILVPKTALQTIKDQTVVFIKDEHGFNPQKVHVGRSNEKSIEILSGIGPGQKYVVEGGFTLKAELAKSSFGEGHSH